MGSLGDEELAELVRGYIESPVTVCDDHPVKSTKALSRIRSLQELLEKTEEEEKEILQKVTAYIKRKRSLSSSREGEKDKKETMKRLVAKLKSDGYNASLCRTSWDSSFDRREGCQMFRFTGNYEYIDVMMVMVNNGNKPNKKRIIIDLDFKSQFEVAKPTKAYKDITQMLPTVFVATEEKLKKVISSLCSALKRSMKEEGLDMPPWRTLKYMQAKWLSENRKRIAVSYRPNGSSSMDDDHDEGGTSGGGDAKATSCCLSIF